MNQISTLRENVTWLTKTIYDFVVDNSFDVFTSNYEMKHDIIDKLFYKNHIEDKKEEFIKEFKTINFYDQELYNLEDWEVLKNTQKTLYKFKLAVVDILKNDGVLSAVTLSTTNPIPPVSKERKNWLNQFTWW